MYHPDTRFAQCFVPMGLLSLAGQIAPIASPVIADINKAINSRRVPMSRAFYDETARWLLEDAPDLIGIMTEADSYHHVIRMTQALKAQRPRVLTVLGGPYASALHLETIQAFPTVDYIIRGEGELAFERLLQALSSASDLAPVGNLTWRRGSEIIVNPELPLIADLDTLPWPDLTRVQLIAEDIIYVEIGRGCPFRCNFCFTAPYWKRKHRIKSAERVIAELEYFRDQYGRKDFNFTHDLLTTDRRWVLDFCKKAVAAQLGINWTCSSRTDTIDEEQIEWMRKAGCRDIYFGVETGTAEMQAAIDKDLDLVQSRAIIGRAVSEGIGATVGFIAGLPGESAASLRGTLNEAFHYLSLEGTTVHLFGFSPYKGASKFEELRDDLVLDERFIDFPLSTSVHADNIAMLRAHFDIFTRYGRLRHFQDLPEQIVRAAEEFFPILNALRPLMLRLVERGLKPFEMLIAWSQWIGEQNFRAGIWSCGMYTGTIDQFIEFLDVFLRTTIEWDETVTEMLRWEKTKNRFRGLGPRPLIVPANRDAATLLVSNPSLVIERFGQTSSFLPGTENISGNFAFYRRADGDTTISTVGELAALVLEIARYPISEDNLVRALSEVGGTRTAPLAEIRLAVERLRESQLLVTPVVENADGVPLPILQETNAKTLVAQPLAPLETH